MALAAAMALLIGSNAWTAPAIEAQSLLAKTNATARPAANQAAPVKSGNKAKTPKAPKQPREKQAPHVHTPEAGPWDQGATWVTMRVGYNRAGYHTAGDGNFGFGFGFTHMYNAAWSIDGMVERQVLGQFADAREIEMPFTLELSRHLNWSPELHPYFGFGAGTYYHKFSGTSSDLSDVRWGTHVAFGANVMVAPHGLLGFDARAGLVNTRGSSRQEFNPVFGKQDKSSSRWSFKLLWSVSY